MVLEALVRALEDRMAVMQTYGHGSGKKSLSIRAASRLKR
jgi:hypothetical protein